MSGYSVKFYTACGLVNALEEAKTQNKLISFMKRVIDPSLLCIDELGFVPFTENGARLLFDVFASRYERGSIAVSTNLTFDKWAQVFGSVELTAALVDRFTHRSHTVVYDGDSVRLLQAKQKRKREIVGGQKMGNFWNRYKLNNGRPMSPRQIKRIEVLEGIIEWPCAQIQDCQKEIDKSEEKITQIKRGGRMKPVIESDPPF